MNKIVFIFALLFAIFSTISTAAIGGESPVAAAENVQQKVDENNAVEPSKTTNKRSLFGLGHGYSSGYYGSLGSSSLDYGTLGGYGLGSAISSPHYYPSSALSLPAAYQSYGTPLLTTVTKHVAVPVPQPIAVPVEKHIPYPVAAPYPVEVPRPYPVEVAKPVAVPIVKPYAVPVDRPYPVAVPIIKHIGLSAPSYEPWLSSKSADWSLSKSIYAHSSW